MSITRMIVQDDQIFLNDDNELDITVELKRKDVVVYPLSLTNNYRADKNIDLIRKMVNKVPELSNILDHPQPYGSIRKDEIDYVTYYGIYCYDVEMGWPEDESYPAIRKALREIWDEQEDEFVRPFRAVNFGWKRWKVGEYHGASHRLLKEFADSEADFDIFCI